MFDIELLQNDFKDKEITKTLDIYKDLHVYIKGNKEPDKAKRTKFALTKLEDMADVLNKRFGLNIRFVQDLHCLACTVPTLLPTNTSIGRRSVEWETVAKKRLKSGVLTKKEKSFIEFTIANAKHVRESYVKGVSIDYKNSKVSGLNKKVETRIGLDLTALIQGFNLTPREVFAIILHEVGHSFTALMYMHKVSGNSLSHEESLTKWLGGDKSDLTLTLGGDEIDLNKRGSFQTLSKSVKNSITELKQTHSDSEREADRFVTTFGLGVDLVTGLAKVHNIDPNRALSLTTNSSSANTFVSIFYIFVNLPLIAMWLLSGTYIIFAVIGGTVEAILTLFLGTEDSNSTTYDSVRDRLTKVKRNLIRSVREKLVPEEQVVLVIEQIDILDVFLLTLNMKSSGFETMYNYFNKTANTTQLFRSLETLSENDLHYLKEKLK